MKTVTTSVHILIKGMHRRSYYTSITNQRFLTSQPLIMHQRNHAARHLTQVVYLKTRIHILYLHFPVQLTYMFLLTKLHDREELRCLFNDQSPAAPMTAPNYMDGCIACRRQRPAQHQVHQEARRLKLLDRVPLPLRQANFVRYAVTPLPASTMECAHAKAARVSLKELYKRDPNTYA